LLRSQLVLDFVLVLHLATSGTTFLTLPPPPPLLLLFTFFGSYLTAKLNDPQRIEAQAFEAGKARLKGLHFIGVQVRGEWGEGGGG